MALAVNCLILYLFTGWGVFTTKPFEKGDFLLEYKGELITAQEAETREYDCRHSYQYFFSCNGKKNVVSILLTKMPERNVTDKDIQTFKSII